MRASNVIGEPTVVNGDRKKREKQRRQTRGQHHPVAKGIRLRPRSSVAAPEGNHDAREPGKGDRDLRERLQKVRSRHSVVSPDA